MIRQSKASHEEEQEAPSLPMLKVLRDCFPSHLQERATKLLGVEFGTIAGSCFMDMTPLQLSMIMQHANHAPDSESRVQITELLLAATTPEDVAGHKIAQGNNALHLAAFLGMDSTLEMLVAQGCDPLIKNGRSLNALEIKEAMGVSDDCLETLLAQRPPVQDQPFKYKVGDIPPEGQEQESLEGTNSPIPNNNSRRSQVGGGDTINLYTNQREDSGSLDLTEKIPEVLELTFENRRHSTPIKDSQQPSDHDSSTVQLIEQDALYEQQGHLHFMSREEYLYASEDDFNGLRSERDPACFLRVVLQPSKKKLYSILKRGQNQPGLPEDVAAEAYRSYLARLDVQLNLKPLCGQNSLSCTKGVSWEPIAKILTVRRHILSEDQLSVSSSDSEDGDSILETYFEPVRDKNAFYCELDDESDEERASLYTEDRPVTPFGIMGSHFSNSSSLDLSSLVAQDGPPPFPTYQRPLPQTPSDHAQGTRLSSSSHRRAARPPTPLDLRPLEHYALVGKKREPLRSPPPPAPYTHLYRGRRSIEPAPLQPAPVPSSRPPHPLHLVQDIVKGVLPDLNKPLPPLQAGTRGISSLKSTIQRKWTGQPLRSLSASIVPASSGFDDPVTRVSRQLSLPIPTRHSPIETETAPLQAPKTTVTVLRAPQLYPDQLLEGPKSVFRGSDDTLAQAPPDIEYQDENGPPVMESFGGFVHDPTQPCFQIMDRRRERRDSTAKVTAFMSPSIPDLSGFFPRLGNALQAGLQQAIQLSRPSSPISLVRSQNREILAIDPKMPAKSASLESSSSPTSLQSGRSSRRTFASSWSQRKKVVLPTIVVQPSSPDTKETDMEVPVDGWVHGQDLDREDPVLYTTSESEQEDDMQLLKKRRVRSLPMKREKPHVFTDVEQDIDFKECNGLSPRFAEWSNAEIEADFKFFASTIADFERLAQGDKGQSYTLRRSIRTTFYTDRPRRSPLKVSPWKSATSMEDKVSRRRTLSNQNYASTIDTGVLYMRIRSIEHFSLPILDETTMASIRIDTGFEKVDTDYVLLDDLSVLFNQEFCLPVCPGLAITLTLHLMQAPHLQPRYASPQVLLTPSPDSGESDQGFFDEEVHVAIQLQQQQQQHGQQSVSSKSKTPSVPLRKQEAGNRTPIAWAKAAAAAASTSSAIRQKLVLPSIFKSRSQMSTPTTISSLVIGSNSDTPITKSTPGTSFESVGMEHGREWFARSTAMASAQTKVQSLPATLKSPTFAIIPSCAQDASVPIEHKDPKNNGDTSKSTFLKWKTGIAQTVRRKGKNVVQEEARRQRERPHSQDIFSIDDVESLKPFNMKFRKGTRTPVHESNSDDGATTFVIHPTSDSVTQEGREKSTVLPISETGSMHPPLPSGPSADGALIKTSRKKKTSKVTKANEPTVSLTKLSMSEIRSTETPLEILTRHILFDDENCIGRSGIVFKELQSSCENTIVPVDFVMVNNWVDRYDYGRVLPTERGSRQVFPAHGDLPKVGDRLLTPPLQQDVVTTTAAVSQGDSGSDSNDAVSETDTETDEESLVAKVSTSLCFIPGPVVDPEDVMYEDQNHIPTEPQNLQDCQFGLYYFRWQDRVTFEGPLFYLTERGFWKEGWFTLRGSLLLQRAGKWSNDALMQGSEQQPRCLDLETVRYLQTNRGIFKTTAKYLDGEEKGQDEDHLSHRRMSLCMSFDGDYENLGRDDDEDDDDYDHAADDQDEGSFYPVRNGFRLKMKVCNIHRSSSSWRATTRTAVIQDFYAATPELAQAWVSAIITNCRERPPKPYWLR
ncbi:hypothetical protein EMPS_08519 [Entomortierella parvispora]|uniref:PH domain-containing protein n=1 Tax=Entomortierella parvispora TaxID=205924 RepID=A0A9P3HGI7_9FUNG|nr:hypothetical protein EMPS_08519 [Entomortierella parvispora]